MRREPWVLLGLGAAALLVSGIRPYDRFTWFLEVAPILLGVPLLVALRRRFPLTPLAYRLVFFHALVLMVGGHYTYARVPLGEWFREAFHLGRNHYDRLGHFAQGFVPAILVREVLRRRTPLKPGGWLSFLTFCTCMAISVFYEFFEWWTALWKGEAAESFLGTQGDIWDTQWDLFLCAVGASVALLALSRTHERQVAEAIRAGG